MKHLFIYTISVLQLHPCEKGRFILLNVHLLYSVLQILKVLFLTVLENNVILT